MKPVALALSPHLDDAVFSAGGTLAKLARNGWRVVVATVFTQTVESPTGFALACQTDKGLAPDVDYMALRRAEDGVACSAIGAEVLHLPFAEAPHRGYHSAAALFSGLHADDRIEAQILPALQALLDRVEPTLVLLPQAIGGHVDHLAVVEAEQSLVSPAARLWWRDYPYVARETDPKQPFAPRFGVMPEVSSPLDPADENAKLEGSSAYRSQIGFQFGGVERLTRFLAEAAGAEHFRFTDDRARVVAA